MDRVGLRRREAHFEGRDGRSLFRRAWLPPDPERALVLVHGFGEHSGRYEAMAGWLAERGTAVHAYDQVGHGLSPGARGHVSRFDDLLEDLEAFLERVSSEHAGLPLVLVGHSMGGLVVGCFAGRHAGPFDLVITSGAAFAMAAEGARAKLLLARWLRRIVPRLGMRAGLDVNGLSRDLEVVRRYLEDPLVHGRVTPALAVGMTEAAAGALELARSVRKPMLLLHGEDDPLCAPSGSEAFHAALPHDEVSGSALRVYPGLRHEIFNEPEREAVFEDLLAWVREHERRRGTSHGSG